MRKILLLADINSPHIQKWVAGLVQKQFHIGVFSLSKSTNDWHKDLCGFTLFDNHGFDNNVFHKTTFQKASFLKVLPSLKKAIKAFQPDVLHAHYASSYGLIGAISNFHPYLLSVWGSDVYDFPEEGFIQKRILKFNLKKADLIFSTSNVMAEQTKKFTQKSIESIPFGIDTAKFKPQNVAKFFSKNTITIGMVKTMEEKYGVQYLIHAFKLVKEKFPRLALKLLLVGGGTQRNFLEELVSELNIKDDVLFTGNIPYLEIVRYHNLLDIAVYPSTLDSESFGVAILESSACAKPVIVSDVDGLKEVVVDKQTGFIVPRKNIEALASAIESLLLDSNLRKQIGENGRAHVQHKYEWKMCIDRMTDIYYQF